MKLADTVLCFWPEKFPEPQAGIVTRVHPSGRVNVMVFMDGHHCHTRHFGDVEVRTTKPESPNPSQQWVQPVWCDSPLPEPTPVLSDETGPAIPMPPPAKKDKAGAA